MSTVKFVFHGTVQGIGFRAHVKKKAMELGIKGWVKNNQDGSVSAVFSGDEEMISIMDGYCRKIPLAELSSVESMPADDANFDSFEIIRD
ncbi:acylphosphatase [Ferroplasma acidiphilum]|jgi:acylphosphatase|uniref:acylphosphatase n=1 Tax=Ferroplasma acidiphilum TaxID=74969 RepID=A0A1V0N5P6_9ARCH|nr:acylphosphatase [Ferroplasma acidiphilum]ARD85406.1 acylphosphatase [Ferroplasma acidiphilum]NOL59410.1 acylphosphatase [Ferroplasma acidiphilum]WMT52514.1 MAG: acylphosphatase [Ferroplasma acidiphilum]